MKHISEIGLKIFELLVSAMVAWVFDRFAPNASPVSAWIIGAIAFVILQLLEMTFRMRQHYETYQDMLSRLTSALASEREESTLLLTALPYSGRTLSRDEVREAWRRLSWHTRHNYSATNYICPADFYITGHAQNVLQLQKAKLRTQPDFKLRKVFIWKNEAERDSEDADKIRALHTDDNRVHMELWQTLHACIEEKADLKNFAKAHLGGMIDFATFDGIVACAWNLNAKREVEDGRVIIGTEAVKNFNHFCDMLTFETETQKV